MALRMHSSTVIVFLLAVLSSSCNTNRKYVKGPFVQGDHLPDIQMAELCNLGSFLLLPGAANEKMTTPVSEGDLMVVLNPGERLSAENLEEEQKPKLIVQSLERSLLGGGAHRELHSDIALQLERFDTSKSSVQEDCELVLLEHLSAGVFADPFQLHRLQQQGAVIGAHIYGDADLERPAKKSFQSIVELQQRLVPDKTQGLEVLFQSEVTLPLHARYPPTSPSKYFVVNITMPHVLIYCRGGFNVTGTSVGSQDLCLYAKWRDTAARSPAQTLQWFVSSGDPDHMAWVARLTTVAALGGVTAIFMASKFSGVKVNLID